MSHTTRRHSRKKQPPGRANEQAVQLYNEGVTLQAQGKTTMAESAFRRAVSMQPEFAEAHNNLGNLLKAQGKWKAAEKSYRRALQRLPDNAVLLANIGEALRQQNKTQAALEALEASLRLDPFNAAGHHHMGELLTDLNRPESAIEHFTKTHELLPNVPAAANRLGSALNALQRFDEAVAVLHATVKAHPRYFDAYPTLAEAAMEIGAVDDAIKVLQEALKLEPENDSVYAQLAEIHFARHDFLSARTAVTRAIDINPENAGHYNLLGEILYKMNLADAATSVIRKAIALRPDDAAFHHGLGVALMQTGKPREACQSFRRAIRLQPDQAQSHLMLAELTKHTSHDEDMRAMETLLADSKLTDTHANYLHAGLGKAFDDIGDYAQAFRHFEQANALMQSRSASEHDAGEWFRALTTTFSRDFLQQHPDSGCRGIRPVFITGLPRSGKTVLEMILSQHPQLTAGGESGDFQQVADERLATTSGANLPDGVRELETAAFAEIGQAYAQRLQQRLGQVNYVTNTSPAMSHYIGMIRLCLPDARVILCKREARDLCTEIYKRNLTVEHEYSHDPIELGNYYLLHRDLMEHWCELLPDFIHVVQFEELLNDPENNIHALLEFCGLPFDAACLDTASLPQPEQATQQWVHYREYLGPLYEQLESRSPSNAEEACR
jgi:tetratricopeptide (TPR) repeat protein